MLSLLLVFLFAFAVAPLSAEPPPESVRPPQLDLSVIAATTLEMQAVLAYRIYPGERTSVVLTTSASPLSVNLGTDAAWTPLPFLELSGGAKAGSGWNVPLAEGLRINSRSGVNDNKLTGGAFAGLVWSVRSGAALQFDWAAIRPGEWNHILFRGYYGAQYRAFTAAGSQESWLYEADEGENRNGWTEQGNLFLGYQMPLPLSLVGLLVESTRTRYTTGGRDSWGDDLPQYKIAPLVVVSFSERLSLIALVQWRTMRNFTGDTGRHGFYQDRQLDRSDPQRWEFYRGAVTLQYSLFKQTIDR